MNQPIIVRLLDGQRLEWAEFMADGQLRIHEGNREALPAEADIHLLVPGEQVLCRVVETPARNERELARALPYQLEDELAQDVEELFFAFRRMGRGRAACLITERSRMQGWLEGWPDPDAIGDMRPDYLALPVIEGGWTLLVEEGRVLLREGQDCGLAIASALAPVVLAERSERATPEKIVIYRVGTAEPPLLAWPAKPEECTVSHALEALAATAREGRPLVNLRQGPFAGRRRPGPQGGWKRAAIAAAVLLGLGLGLRVADLLLYRQANEQAQARMATLYRQTFPEARRIVNPPVQMEQKLKALRSQAAMGDEAALALLDALARAWQGGVELKGLQYREGRLEARVQAASLSAIEALRQRIENGGMHATLDSASNEAGRTRAVLRLEKSG
ncbi:MAG: hypothetical protein D6717_11775 [Gammaproteobacteria bacterium]|nr:MAG: hypothetical protein D6717_11775 [Gammaproteobacteria bacterium]